MSIRSYIAMVYALAAVLVFGLGTPGDHVHADRLSCAHEKPAAAISGKITGSVATVEVDENWLGWLMWEPAVYQVPQSHSPGATQLVSCGVGNPHGDTSDLELTVTSTGDLRTVVLPVINTTRHPAEVYLIEPMTSEEDLPAYLSERPGDTGSPPEPIWLVIETAGQSIEIWSDTHAIDVAATSTTRIVTLAPDADLTDALFVLRYRLTPEAPRLATKTTQGI